MKDEDRKFIEEVKARAERATPGPWKEYHRVSPRGAHQQWHIGNSEGSCQITMGGTRRDYEFMAASRTDEPRLISIVEEQDAEIKRWKAAIEGLTPNGSEYVDDPEACAAAIRARTRWPKQIIELRAEVEFLRSELAQVWEQVIAIAKQQINTLGWGSASGAIAQKIIVESLERSRAAQPERDFKQK